MTVSVSDHSARLAEVDRYDPIPPPTYYSVTSALHLVCRSVLIFPRFALARFSFSFLFFASLFLQHHPPQLPSLFIIHAVKPSRTHCLLTTSLSATHLSFSYSQPSGNHSSLMTSLSTACLASFNTIRPSGIHFSSYNIALRNLPLFLSFIQTPWQTSLFYRPAFLARI